MVAWLHVALRGCMVACCIAWLHGCVLHCVVAWLRVALRGCMVACCIAWLRPFAALLGGSAAAHNCAAWYYVPHGIVAWGSAAIMLCIADPLPAA